ncbi:METTL5 family protein [Thermococcus sp.]
MKKKHLAILLSKLRGFENPKPYLEQYRTPGEVASNLLWLAYSFGDIKGKVVADFGSGTGVLAIGAKLLGARKVYAVEVDPEALKIARENAENAGVELDFILANVSDFDKKVDTVIMNPPFGSQKRHADRPFLLKAFEVSDVIYSIHLSKPEVRTFIQSFVTQHGFTITNRLTVSFEIPMQFHFHRKALERIPVDIYRFEKSLADSTKR